jgi:hypothetical protein
MPGDSLTLAIADAPMTRWMSLCPGRLVVAVLENGDDGPGARRQTPRWMGSCPADGVFCTARMNVPDVCRRLGVSQQTYYRWRTKFGGMDPKMAKQLQELQKENSRLKRLVAGQALDMLILKEAARPN